VNFISAFKTKYLSTLAEHVLKRAICLNAKFTINPRAPCHVLIFLNIFLAKAFFEFVG
jgi:hypothetical protein